MEVAFTMLEGALTARVARADPEKVISNSLILQANKLATVRQLLQMPEPPPFSMLSLSLKEKVLRHAATLASLPEAENHDAAWEALRELANASAFP